MEVIYLTAFLSLLLVTVFVLFFLHERRNRGFASMEQDALLPLQETEVEQSLISDTATVTLTYKPQSDVPEAKN
jgi:hypothetical protein